MYNAFVTPESSDVALSASPTPTFPVSSLSPYRNNFTPVLPGQTIGLQSLFYPNCELSGTAALERGLPAHSAKWSPADDVVGC